MHTLLGYLPAVIWLCASQAYASNFTFSYGDATQCDDFNISWTGGTSPFELTLIPIFGRPQFYPIPSSSFSDGKGSYEVQLKFPVNQTLLAIMSDASGFGSGGVSEVLTVGQSISESQCNTTAQHADFTFDTDMALNQCREYSFTNYSGAVQPVTITGLIPGGTSFILLPQTGSTEFDWEADIETGTSVVFFMQDSKGHQGGSTQLDQVGETGDSSCLTGAFPSSLAVHPSATYTTSSASSQTATATGTTTSTVSAGTIAGAVVGGVAGLAAVVVLAIFLLRRNRGQGSYSRGSAYPYDAGRGKPEIDLAHEASDDMPPPEVHPYPLFNPTIGDAHGLHPAAPVSSVSSLIHASTHPGSTVYSLPNPYGVQSTHSRHNSDAASALASTAPGLRNSFASSSQDQTVTSGARRKAAMAGVPAYQPTQRFILHTDAEEVIELPPQYSALRAPASIAGSDGPPPLPSTSHIASTSSPGPTSSIFEQDDQMARANLQEPLSPGPPSAGQSPNLRLPEYGHGPGH